MRWLLATSLRGLASRTVLSLGSLLLTVIAIASAVVGPSYQLNAANSFVIAQLEAQPLINTGLTFDYQPTGHESPDRAIATSLDETARESGRAYRPGHAMVWDELAADRPARLVGPGGGAPGVRAGCLPARVSRRPLPLVAGRDRGPEGRRLDVRVEAGSRIRQPEYPTTFTVVGIYSPRAEDEAFWFGPRLQTAPGRLLPQLIASRLAPWITTQAGIELTGDTWFVTVDQALDVTPS